MFSGKTKLAAVIATPIKHSLSPRIHNAAFEILGIDAVYLAFETERKYFPDSIAAIKAFDMLGANLSMPYKEEGIKYMDEVAPEVKLIGAINTICNKNGKLIGSNTDGLGYLASLEEAGYRASGECVSVLGGGGAGIAIIAQLALAGVKKISVFNRHSKNFEPLRVKLEKISRQTHVLIELFVLSDEEALKKELSNSLILANTTSVGMGESLWASPLSNPKIIPKDILVTDAIYNPPETRLLKEAKQRGARTMNGLGMLMHQAAESFFLWTDRKMPVGDVKKMLGELNEINS